MLLRVSLAVVNFGVIGALVGSSVAGHAKNALAFALLSFAILLPASFLYLQHLGQFNRSGKEIGAMASHRRSLRGAYMFLGCAVIGMIQGFVYRVTWRYWLGLTFPLGMSAVMFRLAYAATRQPIARISNGRR